jgi:hypothetical protein
MTQDGLAEVGVKIYVLLAKVNGQQTAVTEGVDVAHGKPVDGHDDDGQPECHH